MAALAPTLAEAMRIAWTKAYVILDGTLLPIHQIAAGERAGAGRRSAQASELTGQRGPQ